jgi:hypothetical protein
MRNVYLDEMGIVRAGWGYERYGTITFAGNDQTADGILCVEFTPDDNAVSPVIYWALSSGLFIRNKSGGPTSESAGSHQISHAVLGKEDAKRLYTVSPSSLLLAWNDVSPGGACTAAIAGIGADANNPDEIYGEFLVSHQERLFVFNARIVADGAESTVDIIASDLANSTLSVANGFGNQWANWAIYNYSAVDGQPTGAVSLDAGLLVFTQNNAMLIVGSFGLNHRTQPLSIPGCISWASVVRAGGYVYYMSRQGIVRLNAGSLTYEIISDPHPSTGRSDIKKDLVKASRLDEAQFVYWQDKNLLLCAVKMLDGTAVYPHRFDTIFAYDENYGTWYRWDYPVSALGMSRNGPMWVAGMEYTGRKTWTSPGGSGWVLADLGGRIRQPMLYRFTVPGGYMGAGNIIPGLPMAPNNGWVGDFTDNGYPTYNTNFFRIKRVDFTNSTLTGITGECDHYMIYALTNAGADPAYSLSATLTGQTSGATGTVLKKPVGAMANYALTKTNDIDFIEGEVITDGSTTSTALHVYHPRNTIFLNDALGNVPGATSEVGWRGYFNGLPVMLSSMRRQAYRIVETGRVDWGTGYIGSYIRITPDLPRAPQAWDTDYQVYVVVGCPMIKWGIELTGRAAMTKKKMAWLHSLFNFADGVLGIHVFPTSGRLPSSETSNIPVMFSKYDSPLPTDFPYYSSVRTVPIGPGALLGYDLSIYGEGSSPGDYTVWDNSVGTMGEEGEGVYSSRLRVVARIFNLEYTLFPRGGPGCGVAGFRAEYKPLPGRKRAGLLAIQ